MAATHSRRVPGRTQPSSSSGESLRGLEPRSYLLGVIYRGAQYPETVITPPPQSEV
jgi:hypothetical protein